VQRKYPSKRKRKGYWKRYERARIKDYRLIWDTTRELLREEDLPLRAARFGRRPKLPLEDYVILGVLYCYFQDPFRELEEHYQELSGRCLDHSNIIRWFGRLSPEYLDHLTYLVHLRILSFDRTGDYMADASELACDRLKPLLVAGKMIWVRETWGMHIFGMYLLVLGVVSIVSAWGKHGDAHESPIFRDHLLKPKRVIPNRLGVHPFSGTPN